MQPQERINLYIAELPDWQRKHLVRVRQLIHSTEERIEEAWRGNAPHFDHQGSLIGMHAFKSCVSIWFHKGASLKDGHGLFKLTEKDAEREVRKYKIHEGESINEKAFLDLLKQALKVNAAQAGGAETKPTSRALVVPSDMEQVLRKDEQAWAQWEGLAASHKREYVEWITDAKQDETRKRRLAKALEMIRDGQAKNDLHKVG
jgi:hypothetical protein